MGFRLIWKTLLLVAAFTSMMPAVVAQGNAGTKTGTSVPKAPAYDVVSIRPNNSGSDAVDIDSDDHSYTATNIRLKQLLQQAYGVREDVIFGLQGPMESARFDINAKIVDMDPEELKKLNDIDRKAMLLAFLVERFKLRAHTEMKILPIYELVVVRGGPKFQHAALDGEPGTHIQGHGPTEFNARNLSMIVLANLLTARIHRTVVDKTGLSGDYDLSLKWAPESTAGTPNEDRPLIFTALQEQLGLKLQGAKGPVETLVVDHVERPTEN